MLTQIRSVKCTTTSIQEKRLERKSKNTALSLHIISGVSTSEISSKPIGAASFFNITAQFNGRYGILLLAADYELSYFLLGTLFFRRHAIRDPPEIAYGQRCFHGRASPEFTVWE